jgi:hypothetical protein
MAKAYKRLRRQRTQRRLKNQSFMESSKRPLQGEEKEIVHSMPENGAYEGHDVSRIHLRGNPG